MGNDAGALNLLTGTAVLNGSVLGDVTKGVQQTWSPASMPSTVNPIYATIYREPVGGSLNIGNVAVVNSGVAGDTVNFVTTEIVVSPQAASLPAGFQPTTPLPSSTTYLSAAMLNNAGLNHLGLAANNGITVQSGASVNLVPAGTFQTYTDSTGATVNTVPQRRLRRHLCGAGEKDNQLRRHNSTRRQHQPQHRDGRDHEPRRADGRQP